MNYDRLSQDLKGLLKQVFKKLYNLPVAAIQLFIYLPRLGADFSLAFGLGNEKAGSDLMSESNFFLY